MEPIREIKWEQAVAQLAQRFEYPPTPDVRRSGTEHGPQTSDGGRASGVVRRLAWAVVILALFAAALIAVPQTRAALLSFFARIGAIDIFIDDNAPTPTSTPRAADDQAGLIPPPPTATSIGTVGHSLALFELGEPVGLTEARRMVDFPLLVPEALGEPDEVYVHRNVDLPAATLVWRQGAGAPLSLTEIGVGQFAMKLVAEENVKSLRVNGRPAMWLAGPHTLQLLGNWQGDGLLITSNVLIWTAGDVTYRLEGDLTEEEMVTIVESLPPADSMAPTPTD